ncbi:MAG: glycosyltransferase family 4 protein [Nitrospirae bacterium]|nr:glycosyltransferase family 4 protein [Nitrospirota bacterium]
MDRIAYITVKAPFGTQETFIVTEMLSLREKGVNLLVIPRDRSDELFHGEARPLTEDTLCLPWINTAIAGRLLFFVCRKPRFFIKIINTIAFNAGNLKTALKNLIVFPKAIYLSAVLRDASVTHIHAHWASTPSTMAYVISEVSGIPWSFTAHRGDIAENNILRAKCASASFVRTIDEGGREDLAGIIDDRTLEEKILTVHMGVDVRRNVRRPAVPHEVFTLLCPANLVPKKGHRYLLESCRILSDKGVRFRCLIAGDGPLEDELKEMAEGLPAGCDVRFLGRLPHEKLLGMYADGEVDAVVLPSIVTDDGVKEGIPVALIEAMSFGIPVISTCTGGIPELIGDGSGIMVSERDAESLADVIERLVRDADYYRTLSMRGREKVEKDFNITLITDRLLELFSGRTV